MTSARNVLAALPMLAVMILAMGWALAARL